MSSLLTGDHKRALEYVINTGGNATIASLDDDFEPIGPMLRADLMPTYMVERDGKLTLTDKGQDEIGRGVEQ